jgi:alpha-galactosidase
MSRQTRCLSCVWLAVLVAVACRLPENLGAKEPVAATKPATVIAPGEPAIILTPKPGLAPRINAAAIYGCRPGHPFLYRIPTQGERPITFSAEGLPDTLRLDPKTGIITGSAPGRGDHKVTLKANNRHGKAERLFTIAAGDKLALTPSMGWNDWYAHYRRVTDETIREAARIMITNGMADVGYQYVNIDDCWSNTEKAADPLRVGPFRDEKGDLLPNKHFPDMKGLADFIHSQGLKAGIYSSPGPKTCAGYAGSYQHEAQDARQFAGWGFDFLKYDWCSYRDVAGNPASPAELQKPYELMGGLLKEQPRDIVFNLCQYGMGNVWEWGAEVGGNSWRTARDLGYRLDKLFEVALKNASYGKWQKPGAFNDPDYIQIGYTGKARGGGLPEPCPLTPTEQYSFMSLWCLMAAPLFYSGDMTRLNEFTLNVLCNPEVIEVDQDPLGQCAKVVLLDKDAFLMVKPMEDGSSALGLGNQGEQPIQVTAKWADLGLGKKQQVRDLWRQKELGSFKSGFSSTVLRHGVVLVRVRAVK